MSPKLKSATLAATLVVIGQLLTLSPQADAGLWGFKLLDQTGSNCCCPECGHCCKLDAEEVDVEKSCFDVECKTICIPRVVFPWQKKKARSACDACDGCDGRGCTACVHNGAKTRTIKVLTTKKYKCPECKYTWSAEKKGCVTGCCDESCDTGCDATPYSTGPMIYRELDAPGIAPMQAKPEELPAPVK